LILKQLNPAIDKVGMMVFPGMSGSWTPCGNTLSTTSSPIKIMPYGLYEPITTTSTAIYYQINGSSLSTDYASPMGTLNHSSNLVKAVGDNNTKNNLNGCLAAPGGEGTFYADAISAAQAALRSEGSATAQDVIILLTDGLPTQTPPTTSKSDDGHMDPTYAVTKCSDNSCSPGHRQQQCNQAVKAAQAATTAGTWVYVIAYDTTVAAADCPANVPATTITAAGSISTGSTTITTQDVSNYPWAALFGVAGTNCKNCTVYDTTKGAAIGTVSSWAGKTMTLTANAKSTGSGSNDTLLILSPNTVYDSPTGASGTSQWNPCSALTAMASEPKTFYSTTSSGSSSTCNSVNPYADVATDFQQAVSTLSKPRLVLN
jgi:hypothetical protein